MESDAYHRIRTFHSVYALRLSEMLASAVRSEPKQVRSHSVVFLGRAPLRCYDFSRMKHRMRCKLADKTTDTDKA